MTQPNNNKVPQWHNTDRSKFAGIQVPQWQTKILQHKSIFLYVFGCVMCFVVVLIIVPRASLFLVDSKTNQLYARCAINITIQWWGGGSWRQHWWSGSLTFPATKTPARWSRATTPWGAFPVIEYIFGRLLHFLHTDNHITKVTLNALIILFCLCPVTSLKICWQKLKDTLLQ